jgi:hypothetical protein
MTSLNFRLGLTLWIAGMAGVVALALTTLPQLLAGTPLPIPLPAAIAASMLQSAVLLALAVWIGVALSRPLGLGAPVTEALLSGTGAGAAFKRQLVPATLVGVATAAWLLFLGTITPTELQGRETPVHIPLIAKLLYGGITEELLMRWGLMTALVWLPWRVLQRRNGPPHIVWVLGGVLAAALLFAVGHMPAVIAMGGRLTPQVTAYILLGNALPGILFGILYWRRGLEAAVLAHALAHAIAVALTR